jgi:glucosamine--fructose-6-phosphate aminotransferase (isomerizing)
MTSTMLTGARQSPALVEAALREDHDLYRALGQALRHRPLVFAATLARGSSDHAAALFGIRPVA